MVYTSSMETMYNIILYRLYIYVCVYYYIQIIYAYIYYTIYICKHIQSYNISVLYKHICILYNHISYDHILTGIDINIVFYHNVLSEWYTMQNSAKSKNDWDASLN